jgi:hypothetical protein
MAVVEAVDPIVLSMKLVDVKEHRCRDNDIVDIPCFIADSFEGELLLDPGNRIVLVTLGQFSIVKLERNSQLLIPAYDYCMPDKECIGSNEDDPCSLFAKINFPVDEFFPPDTLECPDGYRDRPPGLHQGRGVSPQPVLLSRNSPRCGFSERSG